MCKLRLDRGRFFAVDPLTPDYPHYTPYSFSGNKVIHAIELEGLEEFIFHGNFKDNNGTIFEVINSNDHLKGIVGTMTLDEKKASQKVHFLLYDMRKARPRKRLSKLISL